MLDNDGQGRLPWTKFFFQDELADLGLSASSLAAQGLWHRMIGIMDRARKRGYLLDGEKQMESKTLAKLVGEDEGTIDRLIEELFSHGVPSRMEDGTIYCRRMVREGELSRIRSEAGQKGGRPRKQNESKTEANKKQNPVSVSVSASGNKEKEEAGGIPTDEEIDAHFEKFWLAYPQEGRHAKQDAHARFRTICRHGDMMALSDGLAGYHDFLKSQRIKKNFDQRPLYAGTFLSKDRWREYIGFEFKAPL